MKQDFPILKNGLVYLDNSSTTQKPKQVIQAIVDFYEKGNANVHRGIYALSQHATEKYEEAHQIVGNFIGASAKEIIFTSGTTQSVNMVAYSFGRNLQAGDEIVVTEMEHHSNLVPWQQLAKEKGAVLKFIPVTLDYHLDMEVAKQLITEKTKIVVVTHMSNSLGTINPVKELGQLAHQVGAVIVVDGAQSVPHVDIDVKELGCDFLVFSGHKMCGPTGIGVLYGKKELLERMEPVVYGGGMISEVTKECSTWADLPEKFEAGTPNIAGAIGLAAAVKYLQTIGMENIEKHSKELTEYMLTKLTEVPGLQIIGPSTIEKRGPVFSFTIEGIHPHDVAEILNRSNVAVRGGHHCAMPLMEKLGITGTTRVSLYVYNTKEDIDKLIIALRNVQEVFA